MLQSLKPGASLEAQMNAIPDSGFLRLAQILGNPKSKPPIPAIIPVGKSTWWQGVRSGRFPSAVKLGPRTTAWRAEDIRTLVADLANDGIVGEGEAR